MKHHIIVKFKPEVSAQEKLMIAEDVRSIFAQLCETEGIYSATVYENCVERDNRYDIMIVVDMKKDALTVYDESAPHKLWKSRYGEKVLSKAIFDCN